MEKIPSSEKNRVIADFSKSIAGLSTAQGRICTFCLFSDGYKTGLKRKGSNS
jgi:hypothetical protein